MKNILYSLGLLIVGFVLVMACFLYGSAFNVTLYIILLVLGILVLLAGVYEFKKAVQSFSYKDYEGDTYIPPESSAEYRRKRALLTSPEWDLYHLLMNILPADKYEILPQTALISIIDKVSQNSFRNELFRIIDFCIMSTKTSAPLLLIELNDASHNRADRKERDRKVADICARAKMPIISFTLKEAKDASLVKKAIYKNMLK